MICLQKRDGDGKREAGSADQEYGCFRELTMQMALERRDEAHRFQEKVLAKFQTDPPQVQRNSNA